jgi:glycosyltransferase involved in cell wall biosynthesis
MPKRKILFLGETYRADAITWMNGLKEFGDFEIITWELKSSNHTFISRCLRLLEFSTGLFKVKKIIKLQQPDMVIAERTTSYGFLAALLNFKPIAIAQQGRTDLWPEKSILLPLKKMTQNYAFQKADLIHAWGPVMAISMKKVQVDMSKVMVLPKGIDLEKFGDQNTSSEKISAIITRSLMPEYSHDIILQAFWILDQRGVDFTLTIVGDGTLLPMLKELATKLKIANKVQFAGRIQNTQLPALLQKSNLYISMPITEGVSASLFEAMACKCYPIVSDIPGNQSWISHRKNGQLITLGDAEMLANEILWAFENNELRKEAVAQNRKFVEENANYNINMKIIADAYHQLINTSKID